MATNPYVVLQLDPSATEEEIVRQAGRLRQRATDEAMLAAIRQAAQALTGSTEERLLHALLTHPHPCYAWPALDRFAAAYRRPPRMPINTSPCPPLDGREFAQWLERLLAEELELPPLPFEALPLVEDANEIARQAAEALWQSLLYDPRA